MHGATLLVIDKEDLRALLKEVIFEAARILQPKQEGHFKEEDIINVQEAAVFLDLTPGTIYVMHSQGKIPSQKRGKKLKFSKKELQAWNEEGRPSRETKLTTIVDDALSAANAGRKKRGKMAPKTL